MRPAELSRLTTAELAAVRSPRVSGQPTCAVSLVVPARDEEATVAELAARAAAVLADTLGDQRFEIVLVDDGSRDRTWQAIEQAVQADQRVVGVRHPTGLGKAAALATGIQLAQGRAILLIDADLQDDPAELPRFVAALDHWDVVCGWKRERRDPLGKRVASRLFNAVCQRVFGLPLHDMNCGLKGFTREAALYLLPYLRGDLHRYLPALAHAAGFAVGELAVSHHPRRYGRSKYGIGRWLAGACDLVTVLLLTRFRERPAHAFAGASLLVVAVTLVSGAALLLVGGPSWFAALVPVALVAPTALLAAGFVAEISVQQATARFATAPTHDARQPARHPTPSTSPRLVTAATGRAAAASTLDEPGIVAHG
ncbi:glycosyltransferase family 2 protein [Thermoleophilum album]|uniref:Glycosyltransferase involved in cell wall bisynthesis n=1 Tax=Thermoleophilum album TaxID=29539 RepID=A0A1H6FKA6_THEAL|nr:glycosyltransferase family 2 protein [Thermoleophilum album]SEH10243.1 Glycosyltransferase involved in cell wall bisynthesis [Thermoleophilum album]